jgi:hypothetical protein
MAETIGKENAMILLATGSKNIVKGLDNHYE